MIATNDEKVERKVRLLREHGMSKTALQRESSTTWYYDVVDLGYNYRLSEAQAALGVSQLKRVDRGNVQRIKLANHYTKQLNRFGSVLITPYTAPGCNHVFHLYTVRILKNQRRITRNLMFTKLIEAGIQPSVHYTPLHLLSYYKQFLDEKSNFPIAERIYDEILSLPLYPTLTAKQQKTITEKIATTLN